MASTSSQMSSGALSSSSSSKDFLCPPDNAKSKTAASKVQCDLCKLSYSTEKELTEHLASLMHHTKLEDKETSPVHECSLCGMTFSCMTDYREHIGTSQHKKNLNKLRGIEEESFPETKKEENRNDKQEDWEHMDKWSGKSFRTTRWDNDARPRRWDNDARVTRWDKNGGNTRWDNNGGNTRWNNNGGNTRWDNNGGNTRWDNNGGNTRWDNNARPTRWDNDGRTTRSDNNARPKRWDNDEKDLPWTYLNYNPQSNTQAWHFPNQNWNHQGWGSFYNFQVPPNSFGRGQMGNYQNYRGNQREPWGGQPERGAGTFNSRAATPRGAPLLHNNQKQLPDFTQNAFDYNWDEMWLQKLLADMEEDYPSKSQTFNDAKDFSNKQWTFSQLPSKEYDLQKSRQPDVTNNDRKRPREDDVQESLPKTVRQYGAEICTSERQGERLASNSQQKTIQLPEKADTIEALNNRHTTKEPELTKTSHTSSIDNASDNLLERAERLCKDLREKRESSHVMRSNLSKAKSNRNLSDKMNALAKRQQSYFKGHIKEMSPKSQSDQSTTGTKQPFSLQNLSASSKGSRGPCLKLKEHRRTYSDDRKSTESERMDESGLSSSEKQKSLDKDMPVSGNKIRQQAEQRRKSVSNEDAKDMNCSPGVEAAGIQKRCSSKNVLTKDNLLKMVNSPKSRAGRLQLARMFQTRSDSKSVPSTATPRTNINLGGLYDDGEIIQDIHLDLGSGMESQVIKLEDLSESVRSQIMSIIGEDIARNDTSSDSFADNMHQAKSCISKSVPDFKNSRRSDSIVEKNSLSNISGSMPYDKSVLNYKKTSESTSEKLRPKKKGTGIEKVILDQTKTIPDKEKHFSKCKKDSHDTRDAKSKLNKGKHVDVMRKEQAIIIDHEASHAGKDRDSLQNESADTSLTLNNENIIDRFPTIMNAVKSKETNLREGGKSHSSHCDSDNLSSSLASHSMAVSQTRFIRSSSQPEASTMSESDIRDHSSFVSTLLQSKGDISSSTGKGSPSHTQEDKPDQTSDQILKLNSKDKNQFDDESSISSSHVQDDNSSQTMSELLLLSEREEDVKQEMMSMELRLTRLHRLLEQAVCQINKCTERRNELHEEEKNLTTQRMNILRAVSSRQSSRASLTDVHNTSMCSSSSRDIQNSAACTTKSVGSDSNQKVPDSTQDNNTSDPEAGHKLSLSKSEWLAKFSAFLPKNAAPSTAFSPEGASPPTVPVVSRASYIASFTIPKTVQSQTSTSGLTRPLLSQSISVGRANLGQSSEELMDHTSSKVNMGTKSVKNGKYSLLSLPSSLATSGCETSLPTKSNAKSNLILFDLPHEKTLQSLPDLESSRNSSGATDSQASPLMMPYSENQATSSLKETLSQDIPNSKAERTQKPYDERFSPHHAGEVSTIRPPALGKQNCPVPSPRNEDSDIGSVASLASGSSLGEKISHYCRQTPGASLDVPARHDLSVILSGPSDSNDLKGMEDQDSNNDSACVDKTKSLYGNLCKEAVKSAEALHLMERNSDGLVGVSTSAKEVKKKKRKTKHERNTGVTRRRRGYMLSSSSEDEEALNDHVKDANLSAIGSRRGKPLDSSGGNGSDSDVMEIKPGSDQNSQCAKGTRSKNINDLDVTIAECDSSTYLGLVDTASINTQSNKLKEMNENFIRTFGRAPRLKSATSQTNFVQETADACDVRDGKKTKTSSGGIVDLISLDSHGEDVINLCSDNDEKECDKQNVKKSAKEKSLSEASSSQSKFSSPFHNVSYLKVIQERLYVGYQHFGFEVFDLVREIHLKDKGMNHCDLRCMEACEMDGQVMVSIGHGCLVCSIDVETKNSTVADMMTEVTCLHMIGKSIHVGLDTGEICVLNRKLSKLNRYVCCDAPVFSMASGQEGSTRLLCVASFDSTITVLDSERCLPLRILLGHTKTAFSLVVHGRFVYSGSGDSTVIVHNLHTAAIEKIHKDNKGIVNCVCYNEGFLFTGGLDTLVRCYNATTHKLVQVYYGADKGAIKSICVHGKKLITGNTSGSVDIVPIDLKAKNICPKKGCGLNFGVKPHLDWHLQNVHQEKITL